VAPVGLRARAPSDFWGIRPHILVFPGGVRVRVRPKQNWNSAASPWRSRVARVIRLDQCFYRIALYRGTGARAFARRACVADDLIRHPHSYSAPNRRPRKRFWPLCPRSGGYKRTRPQGAPSRHPADDLESDLPNQTSEMSVCPSQFGRFSGPVRAIRKRSPHDSTSFVVSTWNRYIVRDRDSVYGEIFTRQLRAMGIRDRPIAPRSPWQNGHVERLIGSHRQECLDHVVVFGERHLRHVLLLYMDYYNRARTHLSLNKDAPVPRAIQTVGAIRPNPILSGLHHCYVRI
jgi:hypothetical protein